MGPTGHLAVTRTARATARSVKDPPSRGYLRYGS
jgi:hypothetical protein